MATKSRDYSVLDKFNFERKPVGVKYMITRPEGIKRLEKELNFCEMLKEAQEGNVFYVGPEDWVCVGVEQMILGMKDAEPLLVSGQFGGEEGLFSCASACRTMYQYLPRLPKDSVQYVAFAPVDKLTFDPDVVVITANLMQAQTILRSVNYSTGEPFSSKATPVVACSWIYIYPVVSGELNYFITGLGLGMQALNIFPPGLFLISVPFQRISTVLENLKEMPYNPKPMPGPGGPTHRKRVNKMMADMRKKIKE
ncbi:MAG: hypothetical protein A2Y58_05070 [Chloroflexi bacterium RBG_13_51_52]|nr:MAG: hypothetical protein A2Y58_05070 [Chloroflexi bacterium RBG_13_51_52]